MDSFWHRSATPLLLVLTSCAIAGTGCQMRQAEQAPGSQSPAIAAASHSQSPAPSSAPASSQAEAPAAEPTSTPVAPSQPDTYKQGLNLASSAFNISQSARSPEDWKLVARRWQQAIDLMKAVPTQHPSRAIAQAKVTEYQRNLQYAQAKAQDSRVETIVNNQEKRAFRAKVITRAGGTPVVLVAFNGNKMFPMIVDTGASDTVITQAMASAIGVIPTGSARARVADGRVIETPVGQVASVNVAGAVAQNLDVSIAPAELDIGLLGNNFFSRYNVTFEQDWVVFRER